MPNHLHQVAAIQALKARVDPTFALSSRVIAAIATLENSTSALVNLANNPSPTITPAANFAKVASGANRLATQTTSALKEYSAIMRDASNDVQARMDAKVKLVPDQFAAEIRTVYRGLDNSTRPEYLRGLVVANKGPALAAITEVGSELTGITPDMQNQFRSMILSTHAGNELSERDALSDAVSPLLAAIDVANKVVADLSDPYRLAQIQSGEAIAALAEQSLNAAFAS